MLISKCWLPSEIGITEGQACGGQIWNEICQISLLIECPGAVPVVGVLDSRSADIPQHSKLTLLEYHPTDYRFHSEVNYRWRGH